MKTTNAVRTSQDPKLPSESIASEIPGYRLTQLLHDSARGAAYLGERQSDGKPVVLKLLYRDTLTTENIARYQHEYDMLRRLQSDGIVTVYTLLKDPAFIVLVLEDFGGLPLKKIIASEKSLALTSKLRLALKLVAALRDVHSANLIHKDVNPNNVVVNLATGELKLIDFGLATPLLREQAGSIPTLLQGTLGYIAPEQTGRMNRAVDYRSDFYSLGATLYELFTGKPPFQGNDPLELIHSHMARVPTPAHELNPQLPPAISTLLAKLLAKTAEERYQSIWSLEADLQHCLQEWEQTGAIADFIVDQAHVSDRFQLPQKLYGRSGDLKTLMHAFERASAGRSEMLFVTGHSGIGKTSLVRDVYKPITAKRGYFVSGKFDQFQRNIPYSALLSALNELIRQFLSESETRVDRWRQLLQETLGTNGRLLTDLLPDLTLIIGEQPPIAALGPAEAQDRLRMVLRKFFAAICRDEHPLALYLDDLQWADSGSLGALLQLLSDPTLQHLLVIAAYRDHEIDAAHPVALTRTQLQRQGVPITEIMLRPLDVEHVEQLVADAFGPSFSDISRFAASVHAKTGGNPYFIDEFLKSLAANQFLYFDGPTREWRFDIEKIEAQDATTNVIELLSRNLRQLPQATQKELSLAACIGHRFDIGTLAVVAEQSVGQVAKRLHEAITAGFVIPVDEAYQWIDAARIEKAQFRFAHDRVQQAAYGLIPQKRLPAVHYRIGQLRRNAVQDVSGKALFEIVNHLNIGVEQARDDEKAGLAELNLKAGGQAMTTGVYETALAYFKTGISVLGADGFTSHYPLCLSLHSEATRAAALSGDNGELDIHFDIVRQKARTALEKIPAYEAKIDCASRRADYQTATDTGLEVLELLGTRFPRKPKWFHIAYYTVLARLARRGRTPEQLLENRRMSDPKRIAEARILSQLNQLFYWSNRDFRVLTAMRSLYLYARFGNTDASPYHYATESIPLSEKKRFDEAYRYGQLALRLVDKLGATDRRASVLLLVSVMAQHWKENCREALPALLEAYRQSLDTGDLETAANALIDHGYTAFHSGEPLAPLLQTLRTYVTTLATTLHSPKAQAVVEVYRDATAYLSGIEQSDSCFDLTIGAATHEQARRKKPFTFHFFSAFLAYHFGDDERAFEHINECVTYAFTAAGILRFVDLYEGLIAVSMHSRLPKKAQRQNRQRIRRIRNNLKDYARHSPANYAHRYHLLQAEYARLENNAALAEKHYELAINTARRSGHLHEEALAHELAGRYYLTRQRLLIGLAFLSEARQLYARWGAQRKVRWLEDRYPRISSDAQPKVRAESDEIGSDVSAGGSLDLPALMRALKAIAEENVHSNILQQTIRIVMQFAGAEKALLLLRNDQDKMHIEADMDTARPEAELLKSIPIETSRRLSQAVVNYVRRTRQSVVIHDAQEPQSVIPGLSNDPYIRHYKVRSVLCIPLAVGTGRDTEVIGLLYAENNQSSHTFTEQRVETLEIICLSVAGRLELSRKAITDSLTGLYNHDYFQSALRKALSLTRRKERPLSLLMIDIDHFKKVNDEWGHQVGDAVLKHVAQIIRDSCRESDVVARYGGEEMVVILNETNTEHAVDVAERIRRTLESHPFCTPQGDVHATASLGLATSNAQRKEPESLIKAADEALYRSKESGRNRVTLV